MALSGIRSMVVSCAMAFVLSTCVAVNAQSPAEQLKTSLDQMEAWLATSPEGPGWLAFLEIERLRGQLAKANEADPRVVWGLLGRFASDVPGLDLPEFYRVRQALDQWLACLPPPSADQLFEELQLAKKVFLPRTANDAAAAKAELLAAASLLDQRLAADGANGQSWRKFLMWEEMQRELAKPAPELRVLDAVYARYAAGNEGLELVWFANTRLALRRYLLTMRAIGDATLKARYQKLLDDLAGRLAAYRKSPTPEDAAVIGGQLQLLEDAGQPRRLIQAVGANFSRPNLFIRISAWLVGAGIAGSINESGTLTDNILGTQIQGTTWTTGRITTELIPAPHLAVVDIVSQATVEADNVGYNGPVQIFSKSTTQAAGRKRLLMDPQRAWSEPAVFRAVTSTTINSIQARSGAAQRRAWEQAWAQKAQAEQEAARHAEQRFSQRADQQAEESLARLNARYAERYRDPLMLRNLFPRVAQMSTTAEAVLVTALEGRITDLAAPNDPPAPQQQSDLAVQIHESVFSNAGNTAYAGAMVPQEQFLATLQNILGKVPERFQEDDKSEPWTITLADQDPFSASFRNDLITVHLRGQAYAKGNNQYPAMNVTAVYRPQSTPQAVKFVRQGPVQIFPPGFEPGKGETLSGRQQVLKSLLERRFNKVFDQEIVPKPLEFSGNWKKAGQLALVEAKATNGWLVLGWRRIPGTQPPEQPKELPRTDPGQSAIPTGAKS